MQRIKKPLANLRVVRAIYNCVIYVIKYLFILKNPSNIFPSGHILSPNGCSGSATENLFMHTSTFPGGVTYLLVYISY